MAAHALTTPGASPRRRVRADAALDASMRDRLEAAVERLIALLDALDGDPDAEPDHDAEAEPTEANAQPHILAWVAELPGSVRRTGA